MRGFKTLQGFLITFMLTAFICIASLTITARIPKEAVRENCERSIIYYNGQQIYPEAVPGRENTRLDYYADGILLNIIYDLDAGHPFKASIAAGFHFHGAAEENFYSRYWHGSMVFLRPLLCVTDMAGIYQVTAALMFILFLALETVFIRDGAFGAAVIYPIALCIVKIWIVAGCMEYAVTFLLMQVQMLVFWHYGRRTDTVLYRLCLISGVLTCFFDFLTTETLTFTVPLFFLWKQDKNGKLTVPVCLKAVAAWGAAYAGMFLLKWGLSAAVLGGSVIGDTLQKAGNRMQGSIRRAFVRNIYMLFPLGDSIGIQKAVCIGFFAGALFICTGFFICRYRKNRDKRILLPLILLYIPYCRYILLRGHSDTHYFFTYRAQLISLLVMLSSLAEAGKEIYDRNRLSKTMR